MICTPNDSGVHALSTINDEGCDLQGPSLVDGSGWLAGHRFGPLCGLVASGHIEFACRWHVHSTAGTIVIEQTFSEQRACRRKNTHRVQVDVAEWPSGGRGPCASQQQVALIHCLNHSGGDNHPGGNHASLNERHLC